MALTTKRIIALPSQTDPQEGDYLAIDNAQGGTHKIPVGRIGVEVDDTLTEAGKAADAKATGDALDEIRSQIEVTGTASGAIATFADGADMPAKSVIVNIEPQQSGTGTPSPENVRQISGWSSVTIADYAVNMLTEQTNEKRPCFIKAGTSIVASAKKDGDGNAYFYHYRADGSQIDYWELSGMTDGRSWRNITLEEDVYYVAFLGSGVTLSERQVAIAPTIEYSETLATTITKALGQTVYGCEVDIVSGQMVIDRKYQSLNGSEGAWYNYEYAGVNSFRFIPNDMASVQSTEGVIITNEFTFRNAAWAHGEDYGTFSGGGTTIYFRPPNAEITTLAEFQTWLASNPLQIVYPLAQPTTYQLTPTEVNTLLGDNNVWADSGDVEVVYIRDLNIAINNLIGE